MEGLYKVEYDMNGGSGRSVMYVHAGRMFGGNTSFAHLGGYQDIDGEISAEVHTQRHSASATHRTLIGSSEVTIRMRDKLQGEAYLFVGDVVQESGRGGFRALMTPLSDNDISPPGVVSEGGIVSGLYSIRMRMLDGVAGGNTGVMLLYDGRILGGDAFFYYMGAYSSANGRWKGDFVNQEHTPARNEHPLFGGHEVGIGFSGRCDATSAEVDAIALAGKRSIRLAAALKLIRPFGVQDQTP